MVALGFGLTHLLAGPRKPRPAAVPAAAKPQDDLAAPLPVPVPVQMPRATDDPVGGKQL